MTLLLNLSYPCPMRRPSARASGHRLGVKDEVPVMLGENSLEGLLFSLPEVGDPNILASYDWNSGFGVRRRMF